MAEGKRIVVLAVDRSENAEYAYHWYEDNVHQEGYYLILVHVPEIITSAASSTLTFSAVAWQDLWNNEMEISKKLAKKYQEKMQAKRIPGKWVTVQHAGSPGETIVKVATDEKAELIVIGTRGLSTVRRTLMGSVSDYVVHHAHCPVAVTRQKPSDEEKHD